MPDPDSGPGPDVGPAPLASGSGLPVQGSYSWLRLTPETTYGTYNSSGTPTWIVLTGDNPFSAVRTPIRTAIRSADTTNRRRQNIASKYLIAGGFNTPLYPSQAGALLGLAATLSGTGAPNLGSVTADYFDGQVNRRYLGGMCASADITASADAQYAMFAMQWQFQKVDDAALTTFPGPTCANLPSEQPYLFNELAGVFTFGATGGPAPAPVTIFDQFNVSIRNTLSFKHYELPTIAYCHWAGRDVDLTTNLAYLDTTWRDYFEAQSQLTMQAQFFRSATKVLTLNFEANDFVAQRPVNQPLAGVVTQGVTAEAFYDCSQTTPTDFAFTALYS